MAVSPALFKMQVGQQYAAGLLAIMTGSDEARTVTYDFSALKLHEQEIFDPLLQNTSQQDSSSTTNAVSKN